MAEGDVTRARSSRWPLRHARALRRSAVPGTFFVEEMDAISSSLTENWEGAAGGRLEPPVVVASGDERPTRAGERGAPQSLPEATLREEGSQAVGCGRDGRSGKVGRRGEGEGGEVGRPDGESAVVSLEGVPLLPRKLLQIHDVLEGPAQGQDRVWNLVDAADAGGDTSGYLGANGRLSRRQKALQDSTF